MSLRKDCPHNILLAVHDIAYPVYHRGDASEDSWCATISLSVTFDSGQHPATSTITARQRAAHVILNMKNTVISIEPCPQTPQQMVVSAGDPNIIHNNEW